MMPQRGRIWPTLVVYALCALSSPSLSSAASGSEALSSLRSTHAVLQVAEELHRAFKLERNVDIVEASVQDNELCAEWTYSTTVSRKQFEEAWTTVWEVDFLDAVYNGSCFASSMDTCVSFVQCNDGTRRYPQAPDAEGIYQFAPEAFALKGLTWSASHAQVEALNIEAAYLMQELELWTDDASQHAIYIRSALSAAASTTDSFLRRDADSLLMALSARVTEYKDLVRSETAPTPVQGSSQLPQELEALAREVEELTLAARDNPCDEGIDWPALHLAVSTQLQGQQDVLNAIDVATILELTMFDYIRRAVEALLEGVALSLQAGSLAVLAEFGCDLQTNPRAATVTDLTGMLEATTTLMQDLVLAIPVPTDNADLSAPLQQCLSSRLDAARNAIFASTTSTDRISLLPLDTCGRLFDATAQQLLSIVPSTDLPPGAVSMEFFAASGEERSVHVSTAGDLGFVSPYASYLERQATDAGLEFSAGDYVIQLTHIDDDNVRAAGSPPADNVCSAAELAALEVYGATSCLTSEDGSSCSAGCYPSFGRCTLAAIGMYSLGALHEPCPVDSSQYGKIVAIGHGWTNSSCPFVCEAADEFWSGTACTSPLHGGYSPKCSNEVASCSTPETMSTELFSSMVQFTSSGNGSPLGCKANLAFPLTHGVTMAELVAPFTVELFVRTSISDLPVADDDQPGLAILAGSFGEWFIALRRASTSTVHIGFYHAQITRASRPATRRDSVVDSDAFAWADEDQHHIAVVVTSSSAFTPNVFFYLDGVLVSSAQRQAVAGALPPLPADFTRRAHVGPPNMDLFPEVLVEGRTEPYFNVTASTRYFRAQVDEVRVHASALDPLALGSQLTELRRSTACDTPLERLDGNVCRPAPRLTSRYASQDQAECQEGYEACSSQPNMCVSQCLYGTLRQADCSCDCAPGEFQAWRVRAILLSGFGAVGEVKVYDISHTEIASQTNGVLPLRLDFGSTQMIALITILGSTATSVSLKVETGTGEQLSVPDYAAVALRTDRAVALHHRRVHAFFDASLACAPCPGSAQSAALGSRLPRVDSLACDCADGFGRNLLGDCEQRRAPLSAPSFSLATGSYTAGTLVSPCASVSGGVCSSEPSESGVEGPWLTEIRYTEMVDGTPEVPTCQSAALFMDPLDLIRPRETVTICAVVCHPLHYDSNITCASFTGNDHMHPPRCEASGVMSTADTYALSVTITIVMDSQPDASVYYQLNGGVTQVYGSPLMVSTQGVVSVNTWAEKPGFDRSSTTTCAFDVDGPARVVVTPSWVAGADPTAGYAFSEEASILKLDTASLQPVLSAHVPSAPASAGDIAIEYRLSHAPLTDIAGSVLLADWAALPSNGSISLPVSDLLWAQSVTSMVHLEWRAKETGYVWSDPLGSKFIIFATRTANPAIEAAPDNPWGLSDHWSPGSLRDAALRQVHRVELRAPTESAQLLFVLGPWDGSASLQQANEANVSSALDRGSLLELFERELPQATWGPDTLPQQCAAGAGGSNAPLLCSYLGPFKVLAGTELHAFALEDAELHSLGTSLTVPQEIEPEAGNAMFTATVRPEGRTLALSEDPQVMVLPSVSTNLQFTLGQDGATRKSCVLTSSYTHLQGSAGALSHSNCTWLDYQGSRRFELELLQQELQQAREVSLNVTVLTTVKRSGYLWALPSVWSFVWLRERAPKPDIVSVAAPGVTGTPAAMVWVQSEAGSGVLDFGGGGAVDTATQEECYFTLHSVPLQPGDLAPNSLMSVPDVSSSGLSSVRQAMQRTTRLLEAAGVSTWKGQEKANCQWPLLCHLPLNGTLPAELIIPPGDLPYVCAWSIWPGYGESEPACARIEATSITEVRPDFADGVVQSSAGAGEAKSLEATDLGFDETVGAEVILLEEAVEETGDSGLLPDELRRRLHLLRLLTAMPTLALALERTHPLQYRYMTKSVVPTVLEQGVLSLLTDGAFSEWSQLNSDDEDPEIPLPVAGADWPAEHALFVIDVRLLVGIERWSQPTRTLALLLDGKHPTLQVSMSGRNVVVQSPRTGSTLIFRWTLQNVTEPLAVDGGPVYRRLAVTAPDVHLIPSAAFGLVSGVQAQLQGENATGLDCAPPQVGIATQETLEAETRFGPRLCSRTLGAAGIELSPPDSRKWGLWMIAVDTGLQASQAEEVVVEATCTSPQGIPNAGASACQQGAEVISGAACTSVCAAGYTPSLAALSCQDGVLSPPAFACTENACLAPASGGNRSTTTCLEGAVIEGSSHCTASCLPGFVSSLPLLSCRRGVLSPSSFECSLPEVKVTAVAPVTSGASDDDDNFAVVLSVSLCGGVALVALLVAAAVLCKWKTWEENLASKSTGSVLDLAVGDPLTAWWQCIQGIEPDMCVFCNREKHSQEGWETMHGPPTLFRCCNTCWQVLGPNSAAPDGMGGFARYSAAASPVYGSQIQPGNGSFQQLVDGDIAGAQGNGGSRFGSAGVVPSVQGRISSASKARTTSGRARSVQHQSAVSTEMQEDGVDPPPASPSALPPVQEVNLNDAAAWDVQHQRSENNDWEVQHKRSDGNAFSPTRRTHSTRSRSLGGAGTRSSRLREQRRGAASRQGQGGVSPSVYGNEADAGDAGGADALLPQ